jgi:hypothetical protein
MPLNVVEEMLDDRERDNITNSVRIVQRLKGHACHCARAIVKQDRPAFSPFSGVWQSLPSAGLI